MSRKSARPRKNPTPRGKRIIMPADDVIESDSIEDSLPTATFEGLSPNMRRGLNRNGTDAPIIGESDNGKNEEYAQSTAALIDKRVFSGKGFPFIVILIIMGFIFVQDNESLKNWRDIWWSIQKCSFFLLLYVMFQVYQLILRLCKGKK